MEVGPTCHYVMGGVEVDAGHRGVQRCPGCSRAGEVAGGMHGSNRLGGNSLSDLLVFGRRAGAGACAYVDAPADKAAGHRGRPMWTPRAGGAGARSRRRGRRRTRTRVHHELQQTMNDLVGIIRRGERDGAGAGRGWTELKEPGRNIVGRGAPAVQPRLAPGPRPAQHAAGLRVRGPGGAGAQGEPRRPHPRRLTRRWTPDWGKQPASVAGQHDGDGVDVTSKHQPPDAARLLEPVRARRAGEVLHPRTSCA